ncbi:lasso peptide biosynthesis B2 protein [Sphingobium phenoxybenzoativorans]|uniref:lasso peptide biosynthesis B2 protein n=1 Tax=Sphingobium phenoxybenzoativorans TaxID=1592790 RepID=UPI0008732165|nr:lasso peptide biosynthesis B2 protein [Sphingobium phenoxybenzoativorans]
MVLGLRPGVSFCDIDDQLIFLDLEADRYFALAPAAQEAFRMLWHAKSRHDPDADLPPSLPISLLDSNASTHPLPCPSHIPQRSILDRQPGRASPLRLLAALAMLLSARMTIRYRGLSAGIAAIAARKARMIEPIADHAALPPIAAAFAKSARFIRTHDQCLSRSMALASCLARHGIAADLVLAVQMRPFAAHSWVQQDALLLNDRYENIRSYTPILVI